MSIPLINKTKEQFSQLKQYAFENDLPLNIYEDFRVYAQYMIPTFGSDHLEWEWFHFYICKTFQEVISSDLDYLTLETHSQIGKSVLISLLITYVFGLNPDKQVMYFTHSEDIAVKFTKSYMLLFMSSEKYKIVFPYVTLKNSIEKDDHTSDISMKKKIATLKDNQFNLVNPFVEVNQEYRGGFIGLGIGQSSHGRSADLLILDDYVNKGESVKSELFRTKLEDSLNNDIIARFQANTKFLVICTRWYERDPIGLLHEKLPELVQGYVDAGLKPPRYKFIKIRAQYRKSDDNPIEDPRKKEGEWLWKAMLSKYLLAKAGKEGKYFQAMYNCDATEFQGENQLKETDFGYYDSNDLPPIGLIYFSIDTASTTSATSDHTAIGKWLVNGRRRFLLKLWLFKKTVPNMCREVVKILNEDDYTDCLIEHSQAGITLCANLRELGIKHKALGFSGNVLVDGVTIKQSFKEKTTKANSKMDRYLRMLNEVVGSDKKKIFIPEDPIEHLGEFVKQLTKFDGMPGRDDDFVDVASYLINYTAKTVIMYNPQIAIQNNNNTENSVMMYNTDMGDRFM